MCCVLKIANFYEFLSTSTTYVSDGRVTGTIFSTIISWQVTSFSTTISLILTISGTKTGTILSDVTYTDLMIVYLGPGTGTGLSIILVS